LDGGFRKQLTLITFSAYFPFLYENTSFTENITAHREHYNPQRTLQPTARLRPCCSSRGFPPRSPGSSPGQVIWDLWWTKRHWSRFSPSTSVSPAKHSTDCTTLIIIHHPGLVQYATSAVDLVPLQPPPPPTDRLH
jgi:hypothetical protein